MGSYGIASIGSSSGNGGIDVQGLVDQVLYAERAPERQWQAQQVQLNSQAAAYRDINARLLDLKTKIDALKDLSGKFNTKLAASSNTSVLIASANATAAVGNHTVVVSTLATTSSCYSAQLASSSTTFATGSFDLQVGSGTPTTITVDSTNNTLDGLAATINNLDLGVTASVITDAGGARLSLVSNSSGAPGDLTISNNTTGLTFTKAVSGTNAVLTVDGIPIESASNTVTGVIPGITLSLISAAPASQVSLSIQPDPTAAKAAINDFVTSYNAVIGAINAQFTYDATTKKAGVLAGDSSLRVVQQQLLNDVSYTITGNDGITSLYSIGLGLANDGTLTVDTVKLDDALSSNFAAVQNLFQSTAPVGFSRNASTDLANLMDSVNGPLNIALNGNTQTQTSLADQINDFEARLQTRREQLVTQFSRIDNLMRQLPLIISQINSQLSFLQ